MAVPSFVNAAAQVTSASTASIGVTLPGSRVNNNALWSFIAVQAAGKTITVSGTGWSIVAQDNTNGMSAAWATCLVNGSEGTPTYSWTGAAACNGQCQQYTGNATPGFIGNTSTTAGAGTATGSITGLIATSDLSLMTYLCLTSVNGLPVSLNLDYAVGGYATAQGSFGGMANGIFKTGGQSTNPSLTFASANWKVFGFELKGTGTAPAGEPQERATQLVQETLESYSNPTNLRSTQVVQEVLESYSNATNLRSTQLVIEVLRSVATGSAGPSNAPRKHGFIIG